MWLCCETVSETIVCSSPFGMPRLHCRTCVCNVICRQRLCSLLFHFEAGSFMRYLIPQLDAHVRSGCYGFELHAMRLDISIATALTFRLSCFAKLIFVFLLGTAKPEAACVSAHSSWLLGTWLAVLEHMLQNWRPPLIARRCCRICFAKTLTSMSDACSLLQIEFQWQARYANLGKTSSFCFTMRTKCLTSTCLLTGHQVV